MSRLALIAGFLAASLCAVSLAHARSPESITLSQASGSYKVEIDYPNPFVAGVPNFLNFFIVPGTPYSDVVLDVLDAGDNGIFKAKIARVVGEGTAATVTFPYAGAYTVEAAFESGSSTIASARFPVTVAAASTESGSARALAWGIGGFVVGLVFGMLLAPLMRRYDTSLSER